MMQKIKPLHIEKTKRDFGLKIDCAECSTLVFDNCKKTGEPLKECRHGSRHSFKVIAYEKNSSRRRTKNLKTRDLKEAILEAAIFQKEIKEGNKKEEKFQAPISAKQENSPLLIDALARYAGYLRGENVPEHKRKVRSEKHCKQVEKVCLDFIKCLKDDYSVKELTINQVDQNMIGKFYKSILSHGLGARSYNLMMGVMKSFFNYSIREGEVTTNPFSGVVRKPETHGIAVLTKEEYEAILQAVQKPELGLRKVGKEVKDLYRPWVKDAIQIGLMTGRRGEEIIKMKWKDIVTDTKDEMYSLNVTDFKVSRQQGRLKDNPKRISVPITEELREQLLNLGYEKLKGTDKYILANDEAMNRETMKKFMSRSFSHYWEQLNFSKEVSYKSLRKTYLSSLSAAIGISNARVISQHADTKVLTDHYVNDQVIGQTAKNFSVFSDQSESRQTELHKLRKSGKEVSLEK